MLVDGFFAFFFLPLPCGSKGFGRPAYRFFWGSATVALISFPCIGRFLWLWSNS
jgi:hypothetical protein